MKNFAALIGGIVFGAGLVVGGMTNPDKVLAFLTVGPGWDATLIFVLGGAVAVTTAGYRLFGGRDAPLFDSGFHMPSSTLIDKRLLLGATLFGTGWGLSGYCPGPALVGVFTLDNRALIFMPAFLAGVFAFEYLSRRGDADGGREPVSRTASDG